MVEQTTIYIHINMTFAHIHNNQTLQINRLKRTVAKPRGKSPGPVLISGHANKISSARQQSLISPVRNLR